MADTGIDLILKASKFAALKHRDQRRKDIMASPYIIHPIIVANELTKAGVSDSEIIAAALLHDTLEDTETTEDELIETFGERVCSMVVELTDDKDLPKKERKRLQIVHAPYLSPGAALVKVCDKIANVSDVTYNPPPRWSDKRRKGYMLWAELVVSGCNIENDRLRQKFAEVLTNGLKDLEKMEK
jgi:guanosine-3',5'-bis(diphosphate) 3'-pyrophosphohydrolase